MAYTPDPHLSFNLPRATDAHLTFGAADAPVSAVGTCTAAVRFPALRVSAPLSYDNRVRRGPALSQASGWQTARACTTDLRAAHHQAPRLAPDVASGWQAGVPVASEQQISIHDLPHLQAQQGTAWQRAQLCSITAHTRWVQLTRAPMTSATRWQNAARASAGVLDHWRELDHRQRLSARSAWQSAAPLGSSCIAKAGRAKPLPRETATRWQNGIPPAIGRRFVDPVIPPGPVCYERSGHLTFKWPAARDAHLTFICDNYITPPDKIIPTRRSYIVINEVTLHRVDDGTALHAPALNVSIDDGSWTWSWDAQIDARQLDAVMPDTDGSPVELRATINGSPFLLLAERISRDRSFGKSSLKISGRGISARLGSPYFAKRPMRNDTAMDMGQIAESALMQNGVSIGWTLDWQAADWLVPAGLWATNSTPIEALIALAESAGAYVQPARNSALLRVLPRYPIAPWDWPGATPAIQIPEAVFLAESVEWVDKAKYNGIYISGQGNGGVLGFVKRNGTAGDALAQMITDPLITSADAVRARGLPVLADTGRQTRVGGTMPVLDGFGIIDVGTLVQLGSGASARRGLVRSVKVSAGLRRVRQSLEIECHG